MIAQILDSSGSFPAVNYNYKKTSDGRGELMKAVNFPDYLLNDISPAEVKDYLKFVSSQNKRVKQAQFHAAISCKGRSYNKNQLTKIGDEWMKKMGYNKQPYIVVYHSDTENNHIHIYSTRVSLENSKKINDSFENLRAIKNINEVMLELGYSQAKEHDFLNTYTFQTKAQLKLLYERAGYVANEKENHLLLFKDLQNRERIPLSFIESKCKSYQEDDKRKKQLKALFYKYGQLFSSEPRPIFKYDSGKRNPSLIRYESDLGCFLQERFGLEMVYHHSKDKLPYGYTLIDHTRKNVLKGSAIMSLKKLQEFKPHNKDLWFNLKEVQEYNLQNKKHCAILSNLYKIPTGLVKSNNKKLDAQDIQFFKDYMQSYLKMHSLDQLHLLGIHKIEHEGEIYLVDPIQKHIVVAKDVLEQEHLGQIEGFNQELEKQSSLQIDPVSTVQELGSLMESFGGSDENDRPRRRKRNQ